MPVRIAYNALALRPEGTGVQTYIRELLLAMAELHASTAQLVATVQRDAVSALPAGVTARAVPVAGGLRRAVAGLRSVGSADLVHGLDVDLPLRPHAPTVATVHDLTPFDIPSTMSRRKAIGERLLYRRCLRAADALIAVSSFTAERLEAVLGLRATVVHEATPTDLSPATPDAIAEIRDRHRLPDRFVLHVGTLEPRKDVATLAAACEQAGVALVLAGSVPPGQFAPSSAQRLGYVSRHDLPALFGAATIAATCSRYEGFGLPPLEAMACGCAVIGAAAGPLPEVLGDAAVLVAPGDVDAWARAIGDLVRDDDRLATLRAAGAARAASFTWSRAATETAAVYRSLGIDL